MFNLPELSEIESKEQIFKRLERDFLDFVEKVRSCPELLSEDLSKDIKS